MTGPGALVEGGDPFAVVPLDLLRAATASACRNEEIEVFFSYDRTFEVAVREKVPQYVAAAHHRGAGVRIRAGDRLGAASTTDLTAEGLAASITSAREGALKTSEPWLVTFPDGHLARGSEPPRVDPSFTASTPLEKLAFALLLEETATAIDPRVKEVEVAAYGDSLSVTAVVNSRGMAGASTRTDSWCHVTAIGSVGLSPATATEFGFAHRLSDLDPAGVAAGAASRAASLAERSLTVSGPVAIVLDRYATAQVLHALSKAFLADEIIDGRSFVADRIGASVAPAHVEIVDDGTLPAPGSQAWDCEGVPMQKTELVREGKLWGALQNLTSAAQMGVDPSGNGARTSFRHRVRIAPSNLHLVSTGHTSDQVKALRERYVVVERLQGVETGVDPITGRFSAGLIGYLVEDGVVAGPVKPSTLTTRFQDLLPAVVAVADDCRWFPFGGWIGGATVLVEEMQVSGT